MIVDNFCLLQQYEIRQNQNTIAAIDRKRARLQKSPYFCVFKYVRAVKRKVLSKAEYGGRDAKTRPLWGSHASRVWNSSRWTDFEKKKADYFAVYNKS